MISSDRLKSTVLAKGLSEAQLATLAAHGKERKFAAGETILQPEDGAFTLLVLLEGDCDVLGVMDDQINHLHAGMLVGEVRLPGSPNAVGEGGREDAVRGCRV